ncbi:MAG: glycosyltransferase [Azoarcus sp.]|jgi:exo-beta-1,3-glucanase (GH17 family)/cellulose synthase/poly-beta-1,6-N-acetylglucosamine synthase-like glycosyltransferase|nr:glycosyltransferase [Azoarcus sp.]
MKNAASFAMRLFVAVAVAVAIAIAQYLLWQVFNLGSASADTPLGIKGFSYSGYRPGQSPFTGIHPSAEELASDLDFLKQQRVESLRTYGISDLPALLPLASERDIPVMAGAWIDRDPAGNQREIDALIKAANEMRHVERVVVGNEVLWRAQKEGRNIEQAFEQLTGYLDEVRTRVSKPVSAAEQWHIWKEHPKLAEHVDFITVHIFPYHEGKGIDVALGHAFWCYDEMVKMFPDKKIVIGEIGWPSDGLILGEAVPSPENQSRFVREFLNDPRTPKLDYFLLEAFDQPWKFDAEGWSGAYWGMFYADRERGAKYPLKGDIENPYWSVKARHAAIIAFLPMFLIVFFLPGWNVAGRVFLAVMIQTCVSTLIVGLNIPVEKYLSLRDLIGLIMLLGATCLTIAVLLSHGFEFGEILFKRRWQRRFIPLPPHGADTQPFVSIHLACYNEPPEMVIATIDSLAVLDYRNFEVLVLDNNTRDEALWRPLEKRCAELGPRFRFFHLMDWPGFKAGALNYGLRVTDPRAKIVGVVDADYVVDPQWLASLVPHFDKADVAVVQAPQAHRNWETHIFRRMCNWEFDGFFRIGMHHRNERNALIQHGTMTLVCRQALEEVGGWSEWCICEDTELGLRLIEKGYDTRYVDHVLGRGLTPSDFAAIKSQRFRWAFGAMQILKAHLPRILGRSTLNLAQRYHFLTGWFSWFGDALQLLFAFASLFWTLGILALPHAFSLPVATLALPILGFMAFKAALGPTLYRRTMACPWRDILGASILSVGLAHTIARGVFTGLVKEKGVFVVTPKGWKAKGAFAFFGPIREELALLAALLLAIVALFLARARDLEMQTLSKTPGGDPQTQALPHGGDVEMLLWVGILALQCIPYVAALACQIAAYLPERQSLPKPGRELLPAPRLTSHS